MPSDHYNCPVGSYTHNIALPKEREPELMNTLSLMVNVGYLKMDEVPGIPRLATTPAVTIYAPLGHDAGRARCRARVGHAGAPDAAARGGDARRRRTTHASPLLGRPTCMAIPAALSAGVASSLGCVGNRVYTGIADDEFYSVIAGKDLASVVAQLDTITAANAALDRVSHAAAVASLATA